jgi:hypothetical protein
MVTCGYVALRVDRRVAGLESLDSSANGYVRTAAVLVGRREESSHFRYFR